MLDRRRMMAPKDKGYSFGGLMISPCNAMWDGSKFVIPYDDWNHESYTTRISRLNSGSYLFSFIDIGTYFDSRGSSFTTSSGSINNNGKKVSYGGYDDWRVITEDEYSKIAFGPRNGSVINGVSGCKIASIKLTGVTHAGVSNPSGILLAPDNTTINIPGSKVNWTVSTCTSGITVNELNAYLNNGCVFLPSAGFSFDYSPYWGDPGTQGVYYTSTSQSTNYAYYYNFGDSGYNTSIPTIKKTRYYMNIRLVRSEPTYSLLNYTCNGTSSTRINTNQRLFNTTDYPNGFRL